MSKQRRTADDFVRDMKAKQQHSTSGDIERKTSEGLTPEQTSGNVAHSFLKNPKAPAVKREAEEDWGR